MIEVTDAFLGSISASVRQVKAKVELFEGSTSVDLFTQDDAIKSVTIDRTGENSKFFGFGVAHKANIKLRDVPREISITTANHVKISIGTSGVNGTTEYVDFPCMYVTEVNRDENTNELSITAYDILHKATELTFGDLTITAPYTIRDVVEAIGEELGVEIITPSDLTEFDLEYADGANVEGTESLSDILSDASEATQTIYFANNGDAIVFKRLDIDGLAVAALTRANYITLDSSTNRRLQTIVSATELGDNVSSSTTLVGTTQYVRDNVFWELREDIADLVDNAVAAMGDMTINQFECQWRGNPALEPGDKIALTTKDSETLYSYLLNDTITYDGGLSQKTQWEYSEEASDSTDNPTTLGEALKQTFAKVDKANKDIQLLVSETDANKEAISSLQLNTESISASVTKVEQAVTDATASLNEEVNTLTQRVEATISAEDVQLQIQSAMAQGTNKVTTSTGFTFNEEGLTINKTGSEMTTNIDEDGMSVFRDDEEVLTADNHGVTAYNLHAKTYLIIGEYSRFEDYTNTESEARTGCFWIG